MGAINDLNNKIKGLLGKLDKSAANAASISSAIDSSRASPKALEAAIKAETRERNEAAKALAAETAEKRAMLPAIRAQGKLSAFTLRTEEQQARAYQSSSRLGIGSGTSSGGATGGALGRSLGPMSAAFAVAALAVKATINTVGGLAAVGQRGDLADSQRHNLMLESIPILGGFVKSIREASNALAGTTERIRLMTVAFENARAAVGPAGEAERHIQELNASFGLAQTRRLAIGENPYAAIPSFDRTTVGGQTAFNQYQRTQPILEAATNAVREAQATRENAAMLWRQREENRGNLGIALGTRNAAIAAADVRGRRYNQASPAERVRLSGAAILAGEQAGQARQTFETSDQAARAANTEALDRERDARKALVGILTDELSRHREQAAMTRQNEGRFGTMGPGGRMRAINALRLEQRYGFGNLPIEQQQTLSGAFPEYGQLRSQEFGATTPEYQEALQRGALSGTGRSRAEDFYRDQQITANIRNTINLDTEQLANFIVAGLGRDLGPIIHSIQSRATDAALRVISERQMAVAGQN
jgi:hypothetical protein